MPTALNLTGQKFGKLLVVAKTENRGAKTAWLCVCECGRQHIAKTMGLRRKNVRICECDKVVRTKEELLARQAAAQARYRARHPGKVKADQKEYDGRPERKERQRIRAAKKRLTPSGKAYVAEYCARKEVRERNRVAQNMPHRRAAQNRWRKTEKGRAAHAAVQRRIRATIEGALNCRMSASIHRGLRDGKGGKSWRELSGFTVAQLKAHLERQFVKGMTWKNMGKWHIDHIIPLSSFNFTSPCDPEFKAAWALTNLRPLWAKQNLAKSARRIVLL